MIKIYHNPRCRKSREGLEILENSKQEFEIVKYLNELLTKDELNEIIKKLKIQPIELVRKTEKIWKENYKDKSLSNDEVVEAMVKNPKLIERPIITHNNKAVIGRPVSKILEII